MKYLLWPPFILFALWWLVRGGRSAPPRQGNHYPKRVYTLSLVLSVAIFGLLLGADPNPMQGTVDLGRSLAGSLTDPGTKALCLLYFSILTVVGTKLICGWGCPFGALQELLYEIPWLQRCKSVQLPFLVTMAFRSLLFAYFLLFLFGIGGWSLYGFADPFRIFDFPLVPWGPIFVSGAFLGVSLAVYRPFCQLVCPFGWYSWFFERFSLFGVRIHRRRCTRCFGCAHVCPLEAARGRLEGWAFPADCFSCARCLRVCPADAIDYGPLWRRSKRDQRMRAKG